MAKHGGEGQGSPKGTSHRPAGTHKAARGTGVETRAGHCRTGTQSGLRLDTSRPDPARHAPARLVSLFRGASDVELRAPYERCHPPRYGVRLMASAGMPMLCDGTSGDPYPAPFSVGYVYLLKLPHLVEAMFFFFQAEDGI